MHKFVYALSVVASCAVALPASAWAAPSTQTIVFIRHGEKPSQGLGQLNCQGLNRALKLPGVLAQKFGRIDAIFAPNPSVTKDDNGTSYPYLRPFATVEPTAISLGLPVDVRFGYDDIDGLGKALTSPNYANATVLVGWEHKQLAKVAKRLFKQYGGDKADVPKWDGSDFDSVYVLKITRDGAKITADFKQLSQGLNGQPKSCPS